ncbi:MAG: bifunctional aminoglycoside phosphotransferase/ATP-binding protein [Caldimonas sp.]
MAADSEPLTAARARVALVRAALEAEDGAPVRLIETHISWVLLAGTFAYKLKKPVRLPFLDFTTLAARRHFCAEELRLNRRLAPDLYLDLVEVREGPSGASLGGAGEPVDVALRMRRFPDGALWSERLAAGTLTAAHIDAIAGRLAVFHRDAAVAPADSAFGSAAVHERVTRRLVAAVDAWQAGSASPDRDWPALRAWLEGERLRLAPHWPARLVGGRVRECHGDLHLGNVLQLGERATAFDCIEFDAELRWLDVLDDIAFLAMDLLVHGRRDFAFRLLDAYLEESGDYDGVPALRYFLVSRALVRAQVAALGEGQGIAPASARTAADYLKLAAALAAGGDPRLAITHGLPGSGKSFASQRLLEAARALRVRSDVERKRLFGLDPLQPSLRQVPGGIYDAATTERTYLRLLAVAHTALEAGWPILVDAAFLRRCERARFAALAAALAVPFSIVDCRAPLAVLRERIVRRQAGPGDASEADLAVLERLAAAAEPLDDDEQALALAVDAEHPEPADGMARHWLAVPAHADSGDAGALERWQSRTDGPEP